ncbi:MAG: hypothetical protein HY094_10745 [Candidatus Melainabacteria bacterium]|nr:hypothetical protein [Candidatus Melainabacteria bacterium]
MKNYRMLLSFLLLIGFAIAYMPAYADELDEQCKNECKSNDSEDGYYLAPEPGAKCKAGYEKHPTDEICCCKQKQA